MISTLKGCATEKLPDAVVLDCGGIGYYIHYVLSVSFCCAQERFD